MPAYRKTLPFQYCRPGELAPEFYGGIRDLSPYLRMREMGVRVFQVHATPTVDIYTGMCAWKEPGVFDYSEQAAGWQRLLEVIPDCQLCLRLYIGSPPWWDRLHPEELQRGARGETEFALRNFPSTQPSYRTVPSVASLVWRNDTRRALKNFMQWLDHSGWAGKVWGILVSSGITYEWGILGGSTHPDYSVPMLQRFRLYLRERYATEERLRDSWDDRTLEFSSMSIPTLDQRLDADGELRRFPKNRGSWDFQRCLSLANAEFLVCVAKTIRDKGRGDLKIGAFYGYTLTAREGVGGSVEAGAGGFAGGHHALGWVLDQGVLDFISSPYAYADRNLGTGALAPHFAWAGLRHRGVASYLENDLWTFTNPWKGGLPLSVGSTSSLEDSIKHQRLAFGTALCRGESYWWFDQTDSSEPDQEHTNYSDPALLSELKQHVESFDHLSSIAGPPAAEVALILDEEALDALALESKNFVREVYEALPNWAWLGAPIDVWLANDVSPQLMADYRLIYVFAPHPLEEQRERLARTIGRQNKPGTIWMAPGTELPSLFGDKKVMREPCSGKSSNDLSRICSEAGVHIYGEPPLQVWAARNLVLVHVREGGQRTLNFPGGGSWREHFGGVETCGSFDFAPGDVRLFERIPEAAHSKDRTIDGDKLPTV